MGYAPPEASENAFDAGPPADGDAASGATQSQPESDVTVAADAAARAPSPAESGEDATKRETSPSPTPAVGQVQPDAVSADEEFASPEQAAEDGSEGVDGLRIAQVAAAAVAIAAAGVSVWWFRRRSEVL
jgi:lysozyme family protein